MQALIAFNLKNTELIMCSITGAVSKESIREINDKKDFPIFFKFSILFVFHLILLEFKSENLGGIC